MTASMRPSTKLLGDAGEHYALSQLNFAGKYAAKMPDNWEGYDLAVEDGGLKRVSVKTRSETSGWKTSPWFFFNDRKQCEWLIFVFKPKVGDLQAWVIPFVVALAHASKPGPTRKEPWQRDVSMAKLRRAPLAAYKENWALDLSPVHADVGATPGQAVT